MIDITENKKKKKVRLKFVHTTFEFMVVDYGT